MQQMLYQSKQLQNWKTLIPTLLSYVADMNFILESFWSTMGMGSACPIEGDNQLATKEGN